MKILLFLMVLFVSKATLSACPYMDRLMESLDEKTRINLYKSCAESMNDDTAQAKLAAIYDKGTASIQPNLKKALF